MGRLRNTRKSTPSSVGRGMLCLVAQEERSPGSTFASVSLTIQTRESVAKQRAPAPRFLNSCTGLLWTLAALRLCCDIVTDICSSQQVILRTFLQDSREWTKAAAMAQPQEQPPGHKPCTCPSCLQPRRPKADALCKQRAGSPLGCATCATLFSAVLR